MGKESIFQSLPDNLPKGKQPEQEVVLPDELKGKTPQEIYARLSQEHQRVVGDLDKDHQLEVANLRSQQPPPVQQQQQQPQPQQQPGQQQQVAGYPYQQVGTEEEPDFLTQPDQYIERQFQKRMAPLVGSFMNSQKEAAKALFQQQVGKEEWDKYGKDITEFVDKLHPTLQVDVRSFHSAYKVVRGDHVDEIANARAVQIAEQTVKKVLTSLNIPGLSEEKIGAILQGGGEQGEQTGQQKQKPASSLFQPATGTVPHTEGPRPFATEQQQQGTVKLTPLQKQMAEEFGMTDQEYAEYAKLNTDIISETTKGGQS